MGEKMSPARPWPLFPSGLSTSSYGDCQKHISPVGHALLVKTALGLGVVPLSWPVVQCQSTPELLSTQTPHTLSLKIAGISESILMS